jgi:5-(carboxyamino)imidazole ribonucleotide synthase
MSGSGPIQPGAIIGILGGGQLGRMTALAAARLGYRCVVLAPKGDNPAFHVAEAIEAGYDDTEALDRLAARAAVVTLEFENLPVAALDRIASRGVPVRPGRRVLETAQHRVREKSFFDSIGAPTAPWAPVRGPEDLLEAVSRIGYPCVLKTATLGYDGKGQVKLRGSKDVAAGLALAAGGEAILEGFVDFALEISVIVARSPDGAVVPYEPAENAHRNHILDVTRVPARISAETAARARAIAVQAAEALDLTGLLAVEMFVGHDGAVLVNEMAPRPHNSGHWSMDGARTDQFEQLVRAICGLPLGDPGRLAPVVEMTNLIGDDAARWPEILAEPGARLHLYGKAEARPGRKMGHVNRLIGLD